MRSILAEVHEYLGLYDWREAKSQENIITC